MGMAHGYYFASGRAQAVVLHTNVGLANGAIGAINAATDHVPVLLMSGRTPTLEEGRFGARTVPIGWGQEMRDQAALVREACKWDYELRFPEQVPSCSTGRTRSPARRPGDPCTSACPRGAVRAVPAAALDRAPGDGRRVARRAPLAARPPRRCSPGRAAVDRRPARRRHQAGFDALARLADGGRSRCASTGRSPRRSPPSTRCTSGRIRSPGSPRPTSCSSSTAWRRGRPTSTTPGGCRVIQLGPDPLYAGSRCATSGPTSRSPEVGPGLVGLERALQRLIAVAEPTPGERAAGARRRHGPTAGSGSRSRRAIPPGR